MSKHWKGVKKPCFEMFHSEKVINVITVMEPLTNSRETYY